MRIEAPDLNQEKERITREDLESGVSGGISEEKADQLYKVTETTKAREENVARLREEAMKAVDTAQIASDVPAETMAISQQSFELPPGTPAVFKRLPEISAQVTELMNSINGDVRGIKRLTSFFTKGYNKDVLELATKGAGRVTSNNAKMEIYKKALAEGGPKLAWEYVQESATNNFLDIADGEIVDKSIKKSTEFRGSSSK